MAVVRDFYSSPGFEAEVLDRLRTLVAAMPNGVAELHIGRVPGSSKSLFPYFRVTPKNPRSAIIAGVVIERQGIDLEIGRATTTEIFMGSEVGKRAKASEEEFFAICRAVFTTPFTEKIVYNSGKRVIWARTILTLDGGKTKWMGGGRAFWWLNPYRTTNYISYEPYY